MSKSFSHFLFLSFFLSCFLRNSVLHSQIDSSYTYTPGDSIEIIETDSSIIEIVRRPPVVVKKNIEAYRPPLKIKTKLFASIGIGYFVFSSSYKTSPGHEAYLTRLKPRLQNIPSQIFLTNLSFQKTNYRYGIGMLFMKFNQKFTSPENVEWGNRINYLGISTAIERGISITPKITIDPGLLISFQRTTSYSGYSLYASDEAFDDSTTTLTAVLKYSPFLFSTSVFTKLSLKLKYIELYCQPYLQLLPFAITKPSDVFEERRKAIGVMIGLCQKLN